jgi:hypothetical protein
VFFRDPTTQAWHQLEWEHSAQIDAPFSADAAAYVRAIGAKTHRHVDPQQAVQDLLTEWSAGEVASRRDRILAIRLSAQRAAAEADAANAADARETASVPGVVNLLARRRDQAEDLPDDLDDVFTRYYQQHPDSDGLEVFDE